MRTTLQWLGKQDIRDFEDIPQKKIVELKSLRVTASKSNTSHEIYEGDNLYVMRARLKEWQNKFDCIYIDPPYNTGNTDFYYTDKFRNGEFQDLHAAWLTFMAERLKLAHKVLSENGATFISIDDAELFHLKLLCDEVFGEQNFVANFVRKNKSGAGHDSKQVAIEYDYMLCYAKKIENLKFMPELIDPTIDKKYRYQDDFVEKRGKYYLRDLDYRGSYSKSLDYALKTPDGSSILPGKQKGKPNTWRWSKEKVDWGIQHDFIVFKKRPTGWKAYIKQYQFVDNKDQPRTRKIPRRALIDFSNSAGSRELKNILSQSIFSYPKPIGLLQYVITLFENKELNILDFFAGSGTTLHATMLQNQKDGGKRTCICINNNENNICREVTYLRNKKVIKGYTSASGKKVEGLAKNGLRYFKLTNGGN